MKQISHVLLSICLTMPLCVWAENSLTLTDNQIQTLKKHFPTVDENIPIVWQGDPIAMTLPIGQEKRLMFPEPIQADLNSQLTTDQLDIINNHQSLYLTAKKDFPATRMYVTLKNSHEIILMDVSTSKDATPSPRVITIKSKINDKNNPNHNPNMIQAKPIIAPIATDTPSATSADSTVDAIRFAWQQLYAPERLLDHADGFTRTPMHADTWESRLIYGDKVLAHPLASWQGNGLYVTAVALRNKYFHPTRIDLQQDICGAWQAATIYPHRDLKPAGDVAGDSATLFLISHEPFADIVQVCHGGA